MPIFFLLLWLTGLLSIAIFASGGYISWLLYRGELQGMQYIFLAASLIGFSLFGKHIVLWFFPSRLRSNINIKPLKKEVIDGEDNVKLHLNYFNDNHKEAVLMTHGWGLNSAEWLPIIFALRKIGNVVTWDLPGLGSTTKPNTDNYELSSFAKNLKRIIDHIPEKKVTLIGHSIGGMTILTFCRLYPKYLKSKVKKISIVNSTYIKPIRTSVFRTFLQAIEYPIIRPLCFITILLSPLVRVMNFLNYQSGFLHIATALSGFAGYQTREELDFATRFSIDSEPSVVARGILAMLQFDESKTLVKISIPTQIIASTEDKATIPQASVTMNEKIRGSKLVRIQVI